MRLRFVLVALFALLVVPGYAAPVSAGGYELPFGGGQRSLGRGGTGMARADDPLMAFLNPASLASMPAQFMIGTEAVLLKACADLRGTFDPAAVPDANGAPQAGIELPEVCNGSRPGDRLTMLPLLGVTMRLHKRVGLMLGIDPPYSAREMQWSQASGPNNAGGTNQGFYNAPEGITTQSGLIPAPTRYMLIDDNVVLVYPTIGLGVKLADWVQIGAGFSWGFARIQFVNTTRFFSGGGDPDNDQPTTARINDKFVPRAVGSVHFIPHDNLDIMAMVRWDGDVAASGQTEAVTPLGIARGPVDFTAPRPLWVGFGIRYADRIVPRAKLADAQGPSGATDDKMVNENWDIEANVIWEDNSTVDLFTFETGDLDIEGPDPTAPQLPPIPPFVLEIPHRWKDQVSVRVGGDWNVMPGQLALRMGASFESVGFRSGGAFIDYLPLQRYGVNAGLSGRFGNVEITVGYGFYTTKTFDDQGGTQQIVIGLAGPIPGEGDIANNGTFKSTVHSLGWSIRILVD